MKKAFLEAGRIINTHGIRGEIKFEHWCDSPDVLKKVKVLYLDAEGTKPLHISASREHNRFLLIQFEEIDDLDKASAYKQRILYVSRDDIPLPEDSVFIDDLFGLPVYDANTGACYGKVTDVFNRGAGDIYEIKNGEKTYLFPAVPEFLVSVDTDDKIVINPPKGIFDSDEIKIEETNE
ncbi:MAG: 16S rRNA processing protein RimM [Ruminococcaceae bacterium]|nr:16S rRNA processing protein RimM [Oscillospiraceae bacterium]